VEFFPSWVEFTVTLDCLYLKKITVFTLVASFGFERTVFKFPSCDFIMAENAPPVNLSVSRCQLPNRKYEDCNPDNLVEKIEGWLDKNDDGCHLTYGSLRLQAGDCVILSAKPYGTKTSAFLC